MQSNILFTPTKLGRLELANRIVMAPMTRGRAETDGTPNDLLAEYYEQRSSAGLIITEATAISRTGYGWAGSPGIYNQSHVEGWRKVTNAVHRNGGRIFLQLWHMGRVSHPDFLGGKLPVAPSAIAAQGEAYTPTGKQPYVTPRALDTEEIPFVVQEYAHATRLAREAWFDGVEIHAANGYLIDQFLRDGSNQRTDRYGGSVENRARFLSEVVEAVTRSWSSDHVGVRLSPTNPYNDMRDSDPLKTFTYATHELNKFNLAYLHILEGVSRDPSVEAITPYLRRLYKGSLIINGGYDKATGTHALAGREGDLIAYGTPFIANPDLVERYRENHPLNELHTDGLYFGGAANYIDYPELAETLTAQAA
ncbi:MAG TPA: alkene reductase [Candidatus Kapabacteria bacterium]|nr:alkene reductase [Candidatus Kapabacteria bacterium]